MNYIPTLLTYGIPLIFALSLVRLVLIAFDVCTQRRSQSGAAQGAQPAQSAQGDSPKLRSPRGRLKQAERYDGAACDARAGLHRAYDASAASGRSPAGQMFPGLPRTADELRNALVGAQGVQRARILERLQELEEESYRAVDFIDEIPFATDQEILDDLEAR